LAGILRAAGFAVITHLERYGSQRDTEPDPAIAQRCGQEKNILVTADPDFETLYAAEVRASKIAVFFLTNNEEGAEIWGARILSAHQDIERELGRRRKPFIAHISTEARVSKVCLLYKKKVKVIHIRKAKASSPSQSA